MEGEGGKGRGLTSIGREWRREGTERESPKVKVSRIDTKQYFH